METEIREVEIVSGDIRVSVKMKKLLMLLIFVLMFSLAACGDDIYPEEIKPQSDKQGGIEESEVPASENKESNHTENGVGAAEDTTEKYSILLSWNGRTCRQCPGHYRRSA